MGNSREQILQTTCDLLENQGFHATGLNEIVRESGAPKGSIYYYFPEGKEEIIAEAVRMAGQRTGERIRTSLAENDDPAQAIQSFIETIAYHVEASGFRSGGPLTIVASESATTSERINRVCQEAYDQIRQAFAEKLQASGMEERKAVSLAWTINAAIEGAIILSRTYHTGEPLRQVAKLISNVIHQ
jgi:TetR/AcrR family transcriptional regulator, lmrAB and yxaGH operons repressor